MEKERIQDKALTDLGVSEQYDQLLKSLKEGLASGDTSLPEPTSHNLILDHLLEQVTVIDFRSRAELDEKEKIRESHYHIIVIEEILTLAKRSKWGLCLRNGFIYLYNGAYWQTVDEGTLKTFLAKAAERMGVYKYRAKHFSFHDKLYKQFLAAASLPHFDYPKDTVLINLKNGTYEISPDGIKLRGFDMNDFLTYQLPFEYDVNALAPRFGEYLDKVVPDKKCQMILAEFLGYVFVNHSYLKLEKALLLYGQGANGKSVLFDVVNALLGQINCSSYSLQSLTNETGYQRAQIGNKLVNYASEISPRLDTALFKQLVSGEPVEARLPYRDPIIINHYAKLIFNCNELPRDVEHTNAFFRRFLIIPFDVSIPEAEQDKELSKKIIAGELSGVFNWVVAGLHRLISQKGFTHSESVQNAVEQYKRESDSVSLFLEENRYEKSSHNYERIKIIYGDYRCECAHSGYKSVSLQNFKRRLIALGYEVKRLNRGWVVYISKSSLS